MDECQVSLAGYVATQPETKTFESGVSNVSMRVGWTERRRDRVTGEWMDGDTSYATVYCWRKIGTNVALSLRTGDPVLIKGKLQVRTYEDKDGVRRNKVEVDASSIGHDLSRGVSKFLRVRPETGMTAAEYEAAKAAGQLPSPAGNGTAAGVAGPGNGAANGGGLRFAGGLERAENGVAAAGHLAVPDEPDGWADGADEADFDGEIPGPGAADQAELDTGGAAEAEAGPEMAAAVL